MDLTSTIQTLYLEKARLESAIAALEALLLPNPASRTRTFPGAGNSKHRGRISMSQEEREQVSRRMRAYWAARRPPPLTQ